MTHLYEYRLQVAGHATRALETTGTGPGIVLLHGWCDSADTWRRLLEELALHGRRAIAVDLVRYINGRLSEPPRPAGVLPRTAAAAPVGRPIAAALNQKPPQPVGGSAPVSRWKQQAAEGLFR